MRRFRCVPKIYLDRSHQPRLSGRGTVTLTLLPGFNIGWRIVRAEFEFD